MSPRGKIILIVILIASAFGVGGCLVGSSLFSEYIAGKFAKWNFLGVPPEKAIRVVRLNPNYSEKTVEVEIVTTAGQFFRYAGEQNRWVETDVPESEQYAGVGNCERIPDAAFVSYLGRLPAKPIDCATMIWSWEWVRDEVHFVVLEDGSVWWWRYYTGFDTLALFLFGGSVIGACLGLTFSAILRYLQQHMRVRRD